MDGVLRWLNKDGYRKKTLDVNDCLLTGVAAFDLQRDYSTDYNMVT